MKPIELHDGIYTFMDCPDYSIKHYVRFPNVDVGACRYSSFPCYAIRENGKCHRGFK